MPAQHPALTTFKASRITSPRTSGALSTSSEYETDSPYFPTSANQSVLDTPHVAWARPWTTQDVTWAPHWTTQDLTWVRHWTTPDLTWVRNWNLGHLCISEAPAAFDRLILNESVKQPTVVQIEQLQEGLELKLAKPIASRLTELRNARLEEESEDIRAESVSEFISFIANHPKLRLPDIVLSPEGNIIAEWANGRGRLFSVHFLGNGQARVVVFVPDPSDPRSTLRASSLALVGSILLLSRNYGTDRWVLEEH